MDVGTCDAFALYGTITSKHLLLASSPAEVAHRKSCVQTSLRTADQQAAPAIARKLASRSDRILRSISYNLLSIRDAGVCLSHIIPEQRGRIRRVRVVCGMAVVGPEAEDRPAN